MHGLSYAAIASALNAQLIAPKASAAMQLQQVSTDSRQLLPGALFVALRGDRYDGHAFVPEAIQQGAAAVMVDHDCAIDAAQIIVADTRLALGQLARLWREQFDLPIIAVTGSNGKTTVKEMLAAILSRQGETLVTSGNLNNDIGVPLTLLKLHAGQRYAVLELGANHSGEIEYLTQLVQPATALITNAGPAHLEGFGSIEGVAHAKAEIYSSLQQHQYAIINADDQYAPLWRELTQHTQQIEFALQTSNADVSGAWHPELNRLLITLNNKNLLDRLGVSENNNCCEISLPLPGMHNAKNALAAAAAAISVGIGLDDIQLGLATMQPIKGRFFPRTGVNGLQIIDDTYNANPASLEAALEVLSMMPGETWLILGDMAELGEQALAIHAEMGRLARQMAIKRLFTLGPLSAAAGDAFGHGALVFNDMSTLAATVMAVAKPGVQVLVKGSRVMAMDRVVAQLCASNEPVQPTNLAESQR